MTRTSSGPDLRRLLVQEGGSDRGWAPWTQGHSLGFLRLGLWRQLPFLSIHLAAGQVSGLSLHPKHLSDLPIPLCVPFWPFLLGNLSFTPPPTPPQKRDYDSHFTEGKLRLREVECLG